MTGNGAQAALKACRERLSALETLADNGFGRECLELFPGLLAGLDRAAGESSGGCAQRLEALRRELDGASPNQAGHLVAEARRTLDALESGARAKGRRIATPLAWSALALILLLTGFYRLILPDIENRREVREANLRALQAKASPAVALKELVERELHESYEAAARSTTLAGQAVAAAKQAEAQAARAKALQEKAVSLRTAMRLADLAWLRGGLECYRAAKGSYPANGDFEGYAKAGGKIQENWIAGLVPVCLQSLPRDSRLDLDPAHQYLYRSDGRDYKIIAHHPDDGEAVARDHPELIDPVRGAHAYGYWTPGARDW